MAVCMLRVILAVIFLTGCSSTSSSITTTITRNVTLSCSSTINYPSWTGPSSNGTLTFNYDDNPEFNPQLGTKRDRLSWGPDNTSMMISNIQRDDAGQYDCRGHRTILNVRVPPQTPEISNTDTSEPPRVIATEDWITTLACTSRGGYPRPTVEWYHGSTRLSPINVTSTLTTDDTYTVTVTYTFTARRAVDLTGYTCTSFYTTSPRLEKSSTAQLYLNLKPSPPDVTVIGTPVEGQQGVEVARCSTNGFRPSEGLVITWAYEGVIGTHQGPVIADNTTFNITASYMYSSTIRRVDNGRNLTCSVSHGTLSTPFVSSVTLDVQFPPLSAELSGTGDVVVNGTNTVELTCTAGTANPGVSVIKWTLNGTVIPNTRTITMTSGHHGGEVASQVLEITPTRDMGGQEIKCHVSNIVNTNSPVSSLGIVLNLTYHAIATISAPSPPPIEGQTDVTLVTCTVDSQPVSKVTWYHNGVLVTSTSSEVLDGVYSFIVSTVNRTHYGIYTCRADNGILPIGEENTTVIVNFPPSSASLSGTTDVIAESTEHVQLTCTAGNANPGATNITWTRNGQTIANANDLQGTPGNHSGEVVTQNLEFVPTRDMDGQEVTCMVSNSINEHRPVTSDGRTLNLRYAPQVTVEDNLIVINENGEGTLRCSVSSRPLSLITWRKVGGEVVESGRTNNQVDYTLSRAVRAQAGNYSCSADNGVGEVDQQLAIVVVQYAPDVTVTTGKATVNGIELTIRCSAVGVPSAYTYSWRHTWPGYGDIQAPELGHHPTIRLTDLTYQLSGIYTCNAHNGIPDSTNPDAGHSSVKVTVESYPIITWPIIEQGMTFYIATKLNVSLNISVSFFSNADNTSVTCQKNGNRTYIGSYTIQPHRIKLPVYGNMIDTWGHEAVVEIVIPTREELGIYNIVINNDIGSMMIPVDIQLEGYPYAPKLHNVYEARTSSVTVLWSPNFNGGHSQTVVIQVKHDSGPWNSASLIEIEERGDNTRRNTTLTSLVPGTLYDVRLYAFNVLGKGDYSPQRSFSTLPDVSKKAASSDFPIIGVAVGAGVFVVICVIVIVCLVRRKVLKNKEMGLSENYQSLENRNIGNQPYGHISLRDRNNCSRRQTGEYNSVHLYDSIQTPEGSTKRDRAGSRQSNAYEYPIPREALQKPEKQSQRTNGYEMPLTAKPAPPSRDHRQKKEKAQKTEVNINSKQQKLPMKTKRYVKEKAEQTNNRDPTGTSSSADANAESKVQNKRIAEQDNSKPEQDKSTGEKTKPTTDPDRRQVDQSENIALQNTSKADQNKNKEEQKANVAEQDKNTTDQDENTTDQDRRKADHYESIAEQNKSLAEQDKTTEDQDGNTTDQDRITAGQYEGIADQNKSLAGQDKNTRDQDENATDKDRKKAEQCESKANQNKTLAEQDKSCDTGEQGNSKTAEDSSTETGHQISKRRSTYQNLRIERT